MHFFPYFWLCYIFVAAHRLSLVAGTTLHCSSLWWPLSLWSPGPKYMGSVVVTHRFSSTARGVFPDQGSHLCPLQWWADSYLLYHQGSPLSLVFFFLHCPYSYTFPSHHLFLQGENWGRFMKKSKSSMECWGLWELMIPPYKIFSSVFRWETSKEITQVRLQIELLHCSWCI